MAYPKSLIWDIQVDGNLEAGNHTVTWDSRNEDGATVASGIYFARFTSGGYTATKKVEMLK